MRLGVETVMAYAADCALVRFRVCEGRNATKLEHLALLAEVSGEYNQLVDYL